MVTVVVLPRSPCQETPFLARLKRLVSSFKEGNRHTPFKRGNQNHHKYLSICLPRGSDLAPVVQTVDNAIHRINHYPLDIAIGFASTYPVDSDLSGG